MPTYQVGSKSLRVRKSFREVLCEQCGKSMGMVYFANVPGTNLLVFPGTNPFFFPGAFALRGCN